MYSFLRIFKFAFQGFFRNFWLSLVTVTMMLMAVFSVTLLFTLDYIKQAAIKGMEQKVDILVSLKPGVDRENLDVLYNDLKRLPEISKVTIVTPEENRATFEKNNANSQVLKALDVFEDGENPFAYSFAIQAYDIKNYQIILDKVQSEKYQGLVEESIFHDYEGFVKQIKNVAEGINRYSWYLIALFALISIVVIFNTIRMSIYTRRDEVIIMKLVGAGDWFIRMPFIVETIIYSLVAILLMIGLVYVVVNFWQPGLNAYFQGAAVINLQQYFYDNFWLIFGGQFLVLVFLNIISTLIAMRKYLRV
jgi:cell division transport system permease protein